MYSCYINSFVKFGPEFIKKILRCNCRIFEATIKEWDLSKSLHSALHSTGGLNAKILKIYENKT